MRALLLTNDLVVMSYAEALLKSAGIEAHVFDHHISYVEGSIGAFPRRLMVAGDGHAHAARLLSQAGLSEFLVGDDDD